MPMWAINGLHMAGEAAYGCPWAAQRLHLAAERWHVDAQGLSMAPMRQICSICCIWLGQAGVQDGSAPCQGVVTRALLGPYTINQDEG